MKNLDVIVAGLRGKGKTAMSDKILVSLEHIRKITRNLEKTSENLNSREHSAGQLLQDEGKLLAKIDELATNLQVASEDIKKLSASTADKTDDIERIMVLTEENLVEMKKVLKGLQGVLGTGNK